MRSCGININYLKTVDIKTGQAIIQVDGKGENSIVLYSGANFAVDSEFVDSVLCDFEEDGLLTICGRRKILLAYTLKIILMTQVFSDLLTVSDI